jgi:hypothetical protein
MGADDGASKVYATDSSDHRNVDNEAVLDGRFRVRGVSNLRVVDMSSWPDAPGFFPTTPTYMVGSGHLQSPDFDFFIPAFGKSC